MAVFEYNGLEIDTDNLKKEDMPSETFEEIYELCGADVAISLLINFPANIIQVPTRGLINIEKQLILKEYDGTTASIRRAARRFKITENHIREILSKNKIQTPNPDQISLFDEEGQK